MECAKYNIIKYSIFHNDVVKNINAFLTPILTVFTTLFSKTCFRADEIVTLGLQLNLKIA